MISIVMSYKDRRDQIIHTLNSIRCQGRNDVEVIAVDDCSIESIEDLTDTYDFLKVVKITEKKHKNPCIAYNIGFSQAVGDVIIIQNPECTHIGDLISKAAKAVTNDNYLSFACYAITDRGHSEAFAEAVQSSDWGGYYADSQKAREIVATMPQRGTGYGGIGCWYNHSVHGARHFHFTTAIARRNLEDLCGFDERFADGMDFDDDELLMRIRRKGLKITPVDDPFSVHLWHTTPYTEFVVDGKVMSWQEMSARNHRLLVAAQTETGWRADRNEYYNPHRH
jgi:glycosyltransferase involved in cell wall biosynthesis